LPWLTKKGIVDYFLIKTVYLIKKQMLTCLFATLFPLINQYNFNKCYCENIVYQKQEKSEPKTENVSDAKAKQEEEEGAAMMEKLLNAMKNGERYLLFKVGVLEAGWWPECEVLGLLG
jgi:hypothetical protein